jgi:LPXTG-site transpeptidase (sortase) family protein
MARNTTTYQGGALSRLGSFLVTFAVLFAVMFVFLAAMDALPEASHTPAHTASGASGQTASNPSQPELPARVVAQAIGMDVAVKNPVSTNVDTLDKALEDGAVRYPTSAQLGADGTVLLFGHSSYLPVVYHQYYKTFNGIQNLKKGEVVSVYSGTREYRYKVVSVRVADATEDVVELPSNGKHLILVTCDSFSKKTNRFVVTADFVGTYSLAD